MYQSYWDGPTKLLNLLNSTNYEERIPKLPTNNILGTVNGNENDTAVAAIVGVVSRHEGGGVNSV